MAYNIRNINVLDLKPSTGVGVKLPFNSPGVFSTVYTTKEQLKYNIINFLLTNKRERIFNPSYGADIRSKLFEPATPELYDTLESSIRVGVEQYFPNVVVKDLSVTGDPDRGTAIINFSYTVTNTGDSDNIIISING